jgi:CelD/BcsL family acetyltransferase involved in cellulose biosynthesis
VDLERLRSEGKDFDLVLSSNTRQQIRRSMRHYERLLGSPSRLQPAQTVTEALKYLYQLADLHQNSWKTRGRPGVFGSRKFIRFHEKLIRTCFPLGGIQLLRLQVGTEVVGILYSFTHSGRVYFYQSGFRYEDDNRFKPGLVAHYMAVQHCLAGETLKEYRFLAGDSRYKRSLSSDCQRLRWTIVRRPTRRGRLLLLGRRMKRSVGWLLKRNGPSRTPQPITQVERGGSRK